MTAADAIRDLRSFKVDPAQSGAARGAMRPGVAPVPHRKVGRGIARTRLCVISASRSQACLLRTPGADPDADVGRTELVEGK